MSAELKPGYKQTEVGVIPEDWGVVTVGEIADVKTGPFGSTLHEKDYVNVGTPIVTVEHLGERGIQHTNLPMVSDTDRVRLKAYALRKSDIVFSRVGSVDRNALVRMGEEGWLFSGRLLRVRLKCKDNDAQYLSYHFHSEGFKQRVRDVAVGQTMASLNTRILMGVLTVIPPTKAEQEAIAEALSDADALIESLEQLIAKKRHIQQGAMQWLLSPPEITPMENGKLKMENEEGGTRNSDNSQFSTLHSPFKKRLPGFSGEWEMKRLGDVAEIVMGQSPSSSHYNNKGDGLPLIQGNADIANRKTIKRVFTTEITKRGRCGDILMSVRAPVGEIAHAIFDVCLGRGVCSIRYANDFLYHFLIAKESTWVKLSKGSTFDSVNSTDVKAFEIGLPSEYEEQVAIATILSDMDAEIAALEAKLAKARQIKQGMMQELLTGRIRLV